MADVVLPAAIWGEKTGCSTNVDRVVHLNQKAIEPPGDATIRGFPTRSSPEVRAFPSLPMRSIRRERCNIMPISCFRPTRIIAKVSGTIC